MANPLCYVVDNGGNGNTKATGESTVTRRMASGTIATHSVAFIAGSTCSPWRSVNQGLFASRVETRNAVVFEPRAQDMIVVLAMVVAQRVGL